MQNKIEYTRAEASSILQIPIKSVSKLIKSGKLSIVESKKITVESILSYKKELDERRSIPKAVWVYRNEF